MTTFFHQLVAITTGMILAAPPGLCSIFEWHEGPVEQASCCHTATSKPTVDAEHVPPAPTSYKCCCSQDASLPAKTVKLFSPPNLAVFVTSQASQGLSSLPSGETALTPIPPGPSLNVLQCVWLC
jgi:hypothetical protein